MRIYEKLTMRYLENFLGKGRWASLSTIRVLFTAWDMTCHVWLRHRNGHINYICYRLNSILITGSLGEEEFRRTSEVSSYKSSNYPDQIDDTILIYGQARSQAESSRGENCRPESARFFHTWGGVRKFINWETFALFVWFLHHQAPFIPNEFFFIYSDGYSSSEEGAALSAHFPIGSLPLGLT